MCNFIFLTDTASDLTKDMLSKTVISELIPLSFTIDETNYVNTIDRTDMEVSDFYALLRTGKMATTSMVNTETYKDYFEKYLKDGKDIFYLAFSSGLSGSYNASTIAAQELLESYPERKIVIVDSLSASLGYGLLAFLTSEQIMNGASLEQAAKWAEDNRLNLCHWFTVDDLDFLKRGGRLSGAAAYFGTLLGIKPILHVDDEGHLVAMEKVRGRKMSLDGLVKRLETKGLDIKNQAIFISHGDCIDDANYVANEIKQKFGVKRIEIGHVGPVIGSHSGPGTIALFFLGSDRA